MVFFTTEVVCFCCGWSICTMQYGSEQPKVSNASENLNLQKLTAKGFEKKKLKEKNMTQGKMYLGRLKWAKKKTTHTLCFEDR